MSNLLKYNKKLMKEYNYEKNTDIDLDTLTFKSGKRIWWKCKEGHEWESIVANRSRGQKCPVCSGKKIVLGINDIFTIFPDLKKEWDYEKNIINPQTLSAYSNKDAFWICKLKHKYKMRVSHRTSGHGCPYCAGNKILEGFNDLKSWSKENNPNILKKWDYSKNGEIPVNESRNSKRIVWWKCQVCGNEYTNKICNEVSNIFCPKCNKRNKTSFPEQAIYFYIKKIFADAINSFKDLKNNITELDIYIPSKRIGIEYDGEAWHNNESSRKKELLKYNACKKNNITLIRFKEKIENSDKDTCDFLIESSYNKNVLAFNKELQLFLNNYKKIDVNLERDRNEIYKQYLTTMREKSLLLLFPSIASEWDYEKNYPLRPENISKGYDKKVWWICPKCKKSYKCSPNTRISGNVGCSNCNGGVAKPINQYDLDGVLISTYESCSAASKKLNVSSSLLSRACKNFTVAHNSQWRYANEVQTNSINPYVPTLYNNKKVEQYTLDGKYIKTFDSITIAKKETGACKIGDVCAGNRKTSGGYIWKYKNN